MERTHMSLKAMIEGLLFLVGEEGLSVEQLCRVLDTDQSIVIDIMSDLKANYTEVEHGFELVTVAGVYKFVTKPELAPYIQRLMDEPQKKSLSQAALETLAIIAYKQPVTKADMEDIRGVKTERVLQTVMSHALVKEVGRAEGVGRPILYGTTDEFLTHFGLTSLQELPPFPDELKQPTEEDMALFEQSYPMINDNNRDVSNRNVF